MKAATSDTGAVDTRDWITRNAHPVGTDPAGPLTDLRPLAERARGAAVVGIGETTRAAAEVTTLAHRILRLLVEELGFRVLAIQDDETAVAGLDDYARTGAGAPSDALRELWVPWRTREMLAVLTWARAFNERNPGDPLRFLGLNEPGARPADHGAVVDAVAQVDGGVAARIREHYAVIETAHEVPEHVQIARGTHPGRPFTEHARDALALVEAVAVEAATAGEATLGETTLGKAERILEFHAGSFAGGGFDYAATRDRTVAALTSLTDAGTKVAYWEGMAFTANAARLEPSALLDPFQTVGNELRRRLGDGYLPLLIGFGHGDVSGLHPGQWVPEPMAGSTDAVLTAAEPDTYLLDLRGPQPERIARWLRAPRPLRGIGGIYDASADHEAYLPTARLGEWFDAVLHVRAVTPTTLL